MRKIFPGLFNLFFKKKSQAVFTFQKKYVINIVGQNLKYKTAKRDCIKKGHRKGGGEKMGRKWYKMKEGKNRSYVSMLGVGNSLENRLVSV